VLLPSGRSLLHQRQSDEPAWVGLGGRLIKSIWFAFLILYCTDRQSLRSDAGRPHGGWQPPPGTSESGTPSAALNGAHPLVLPAPDASPTATDTPAFVLADPAIALVSFVEIVPAPKPGVAAMVPGVVVPMPTPLGVVVPVPTPLVAAVIGVPALPDAGIDPVRVAPMPIVVPAVVCQLNQRPLRILELRLKHRSRFSASLCPRRLTRMMFLMCSQEPTKFNCDKEGQMHCQYCGDLMCSVTAIRVRRTLFGLRHSRRPGAYCAGCKVSTVFGEADAPSALRARAVQWVSLRWRRSLPAPSRFDSLATDEQPAHCA